MFVCKSSLCLVVYLFTEWNTTEAQWQIRWSFHDRWQCANKQTSILFSHRPNSLIETDDCVSSTRDMWCGRLRFLIKEFIKAFLCSTCCPQGMFLLRDLRATSCFQHFLFCGWAFSPKVCSFSCGWLFAFRCWLVGYFLTAQIKFWFQKNQKNRLWVVEVTCGPSHSCVDSYCSYTHNNMDWNRKGPRNQHSASLCQHHYGWQQWEKAELCSVQCFCDLTEIRS